MTDPMITVANTLESSPKPSYGPHKASERYLDAEDWEATWPLARLIDDEATEEEKPLDDFLKALETLRTHLRKKYYGG